MMKLALFLNRFIFHIGLISIIPVRLSTCAEVDPSSTIVTGPGLQPNLVFPARYFFIQAVDSDGQNFTESAGAVFTVSVSALTGTCRSWTQVLDRHDGTYIVRYRLFQTCDGLRINVSHGNTAVAQSPYEYEGHVYNEECYCPVRDLNTWQDKMFCPTWFSQIENDLSNFPSVDMDVLVATAVKTFNQAGSQSICNYVILDNKVYRNCYGQHVGFKVFVDSILLSMTRKAVLPDMELLINLGDWPLVRRDAVGDVLPMFSWCGSKETYDIVMPTYDLTESTLETMGRVSLDILSVQSNDHYSWSNKIQKGFWRGRDSRRDRLQLVYMGRRNPDLLNASLTNFFFFQDLENEYGPKVPHISFFDFFKFKYQVNIDGTVAAYRMPYLLAGNSLVLKQESIYYEHFYNDLEPDVHYLPFKRDLSDLLDKIRWAKNNDDIAHEIAQNGRQFVQETLMPKDIFCYYAALFKKFSERISSTIKIRPDMEYVPQPVDDKSRCSCHRLDKNARDEL